MKCAASYQRYSLYLHTYCWYSSFLYFFFRSILLYFFDAHKHTKHIHYTCFLCFVLLIGASIYFFAFFFCFLLSVQQNSLQDHFYLKKKKHMEYEMLLFRVRYLIPYHTIYSLCVG